MKRFLYVSFENSSKKSSGVNKKIAGQIDAFKEKGYSVDLIAVYEKGIALYKDNCLNDVFRSNLIPRISLCSWVSKHAKKYEVVYIRFQFFCPFVLKMVENLKRNNVIVIMEIPTYPYKRELKSQGIKGTLKGIIDSIFRPFCLRYIDALASPLADETIFGKETICIYNGINTSSISPRKPKKDNTIDLLAVALMAPWHGYDRLIKGIHNYYENGGKRNIVLHLVGDGAVTLNYQKMIEEYSLKKHVILYGKKFGDDLDAIYDSVDIGVGSLASFRKNIYKTNTLKVLEYLAKGLPVICEEGEMGIPKDSFYRLSIKSDSSPINIDNVIGFYDKIYRDNNDINSTINEIRNYCINNCSVSNGLKGVFDYLDSKESII